LRGVCRKACGFKSRPEQIHPRWSTGSQAPRRSNF